MKNSERHQDLVTRAALLSESVVRAYVQSAAAGSPRYGKALLKYGAAVGRLVQEATFLGGPAWRRAAEACHITHLSLAALYLNGETPHPTCRIRLIQQAASLARHLSDVADTMERIGGRFTTGKKPNKTPVV